MAPGRHLRTVRGRATWQSMVVVLIAMSAGAVVVLAVFGIGVERNLDDTLRQQVADRVGLIEDGADPGAFGQARQGEAFVWIGTPDGTVIASGGEVEPVENPVPEALDRAQEVELLVEERSGNEVERERKELRILAQETNDGAIVVVAGTQIEGLGDALRGLTVLFAIAVPIVVVLVGVLTWRATGRALRPVEEIRRQAATVTGDRLAERVPVPSEVDEIHDLAVTVNEMLDRIEAHERSLRQFTADASHELRTPVANMRVMVESAEVDDAAWPDLRRRLVAETERLGGLVDDLLYLAKRDAGHAARARATVHLDDVLFDEAEFVAATGSVRVDIGAVEPATVHGERDPLQRMVRNLVDNAVRHAGGTVWLGSRTAEDGAVELVVRDDGPGIAAADRERVFERFTQLDAARRRDRGGAGLGLAIARQVAHDHGGTIEVFGADDEGRPADRDDVADRESVGGAVFRVRLPATHERSEPGGRAD